LVELRSYSCCICPNTAYVRLNGEYAWRASWCTGDPWPTDRGVVTLLIDPFNCSARELRLFDTYAFASDAEQLGYYLQLLDHGSVVVAATGDEPVTNLPSALPALRQLGVEVGDVWWRGSFGFIVQKGFPGKTVLRKVLTIEESGTNPASVNAAITGTR